MTDRLSPAEQLLFDGKRVLIKTQERAARADSGVIVDYLRFTVKHERLKDLEDAHLPQSDAAFVRLLAQRLAQLTGFSFGEARQKGRDYYDHTCTIWNANGHEVGSVSGGGEYQRGTFCFTLKGEGCTYAAQGWERAVYDFAQALDAKITRIDLARDYFTGEKGGVEAVRAGYLNGEFDYRNRRPSQENAGCWDNGHSRTYYVGKRESGKMFRAYEKGHQYGDMNSQWWRAEVEYRSHQRIIPLEALIRPANYFAGAYEYCADLLLDVLPVTVPTAHAVAEASTERTVRWVERTVAPAVVHLSLNCGFDWLTRLVIEHADRPLPKALRGLQPEAIKQGMDNATKRFTRSTPEPALCAPINLPETESEPS
ncbi:replication initiation factor domain-containing protein [Macromonas nakdongensis]|uniref:replication initiation factor domain-containing protein n=1 Tax=Macromonas nakdongensis TaxID=1843082 RepID=UPI000C32A1CF|nr:replication initiation factor domain-containing protein [Macromonas nakdongensis]